MPEFIDIDVSEMTDGSEITMGDIKLPAGVKLLSKKDEIVAKVVKAEAGPEAEAESEAAAAGTQETAEAKETA
ncbi:hypothetical protein [Thermoclostridium stercorarium]|uniref:hypothetical protein n=1 Tax=Thermoclostridium stercorarium TaxID=1510 RepID=UPI000B2FF7BF|nr:hypothetical protein [Thermoclostridium stercorarium]